MKSTKSKLVKKKGKLVSSNRVWSKEAREKFNEYQTTYYKENIRLFTMRYNRKTDADVIDFIESLDNVSGYFRDMNRKEIKKKEKRDAKKKERGESDPK